MQEKNKFQQMVKIIMKMKPSTPKTEEAAATLDPLLQIQNLGEIPQEKKVEKR